MQKLSDILTPIMCKHKAHYFSGHDHILQVNRLPCGSISIVSGAAGKTKSIYDELRPSQQDTLVFAKGKVNGFMHLKVTAEDMDLQVIDITQAVLYSERHIGARQD